MRGAHYSGASCGCCCSTRTYSKLARQDGPGSHLGTSLDLRRHSWGARSESSARFGSLTQCRSALIAAIHAKTTDHFTCMHQFNMHSAGLVLDGELYAAVESAEGLAGSNCYHNGRDLPYIDTTFLGPVSMATVNQTSIAYRRFGPLDASLPQQKPMVRAMPGRPLTRSGYPEINNAQLTFMVTDVQTNKRFVCCRCSSSASA